MKLIKIGISLILIGMLLAILLTLLLTILKIAKIN